MTLIRPCIFCPQGLLRYLARLDTKSSGITIGQLLPRYTSYILCDLGFAKDYIHIQDGPRVGLYQGGKLSLSTGLTSTSPPSFFHFLNLAAGAGPGPVQEVERSSGCDQCQALEEDPDRAEAVCPNDFHTARRWLRPVVQAGSRSGRGWVQPWWVDHGPFIGPFEERTWMHLKNALGSHWMLNVGLCQLAPRDECWYFVFQVQYSEGQCYQYILIDQKRSTQYFNGWIHTFSMFHLWSLLSLSHDVLVC